MHEKAESERREMEARMLIFMMNRSARILQKYFFLACVNRCGLNFCSNFLDIGEFLHQKERKRRESVERRNKLFSVLATLKI